MSAPRFYESDSDSESDDEDIQMPRWGCTDSDWSMSSPSRMSSSHSRMSPSRMSSPTHMRSTRMSPSRRMSTSHYTRRPRASFGMRWADTTNDEDIEDWGAGQVLEGPMLNTIRTVDVYGNPVEWMEEDEGYMSSMPKPNWWSMSTGSGSCSSCGGSKSSGRSANWGMWDDDMTWGITTHSELRKRPTRNLPGMSNSGRYSDKDGPFCGSDNTYPVGTPGRARSALSYRRFSENPEKIKKCVCNQAKRKNWNFPSCGVEGRKMKRSPIRTKY